jgi:hypothetical protein
VVWRLHGLVNRQAPAETTRIIPTSGTRAPSSRAIPTRPALVLRLIHTLTRRRVNRTLLGLRRGFPLHQSLNHTKDSMARDIPSVRHMKVTGFRPIPTARLPMVNRSTLPRMGPLLASTLSPRLPISPRDLPVRLLIRTPTPRPRMAHPHSIRSNRRTDILVPLLCLHPCLPLDYPSPRLMVLLLAFRQWTTGLTLPHLRQGIQRTLRSTHRIITTLAAQTTIHLLWTDTGGGLVVTAAVRIDGEIVEISGISAETVKTADIEATTPRTIIGTRVIARKIEVVSIVAEVRGIGKTVIVMATIVGAIDLVVGLEATSKSIRPPKIPRLTLFLYPKTTTYRPVQSPNRRKKSYRPTTRLIPLSPPSKRSRVQRQ